MAPPTALDFVDWALRVHRHPIANRAATCDQRTQVYFTGAKFTAGMVAFTDAKFTAGEVAFTGAEFTGGTVSFTDAESTGGTVKLRDVSSWKVPPLLDGAVLASRDGTTAW